MRITTLLTVPILAALIALPARAQAQTSISVSIGTPGPAFSVQAYSVERYGAWETNYQRWTPVTMYVVDGQYYRTQVRDRDDRVVSRPVQMYSYRNQYFSPPTDQRWEGRDRRFNNRGRNGNMGRGHGPKN
jgi:hypothetical protein